jgi:hypothetical protein
MKRFFSIVFLIPLFVFGQEFDRKSYVIKRASLPPIIDGNMNDGCWQKAAFAGNFIMKEPQNGKMIEDRFKTEWKSVYDNKAIYFIIQMHDPAPDSILKQLCPRDELDQTNADQIGVWINPYNDGQNDFYFAVSAAGVQADAKYSNYDIDRNWDMVWECKVSIKPNGWIAEIKIPYSALRFPKTDVQTWGLNIGRGLRRYREFHTWNFIDISKENVRNQTGLLKGLKDIKPPLRLSIMPYISSDANSYKGEENIGFNGGMDLKYGINESFTLDMTLIPDFGQVGFDNQVLNLTPFEVQYDEKRAFFTEGTNLLEKGGLFYSRRISDNLLNATKITGRNKNNLGIGVLNAVSGKNEETADVLSNYNIFVLDQRLNNNSSFTLTNTNVQRKNNEDNEANVTGLNMILQDENSNYQFNWRINQSQVVSNAIQTNGYATFFELLKTSGKFRYFFSRYIESDKYNPNEMGFLYNNNEVTDEIELSYRTIQPTKYFVNYYASVNIDYSRLYKPRMFTSTDIYFSQRATLKNYLTLGISSRIVPVLEHDYFEARQDLKQVFKKSDYYGVRAFFSSDYRKKFALDGSLRAGLSPLYKGLVFAYRVSPRFRFNDKLFATYVFSTEQKRNDAGYALTDNSKAIFALRDIEFFTNVLEAQYVMNNKMSAKVKFRHHWEQVKNHSFYVLSEDGFLINSSYQGDHDVNFNAWNIDLSYSWWFAPGSEVSVVYKNAILAQGDQVLESYKNNMEFLFENPQENSLSLKLRYYFDYQYLKRK